MRQLLIALQFLTIIPVGTKSAVAPEKLPLGLVYFPVIGFFLGLILVSVNKLLLLLALDKLVISTILVILLIVLTGALHLDGLADTFDGLMSGKKREKMLEIMRDSHIGTMGVLSLICIILLKIIFLWALDAKILSFSLILMCVLSRYSLVLASFSFAYAREEGKAKAFVQKIKPKIFYLATAITLFFVFFILGWKGLLLFLGVLVFTLLLGKFITAKTGGITGDMLGAINELTEVFVLFVLLSLTRCWI